MFARAHTEILLATSIALSALGCAGTREFTVQHTFPVPVDQLWHAVADNYGDISKSHPTLYRSNYVEGSTKGELGAMRRIEFKEDGSKALNEKIVQWDPTNRTFQVQLVEAEGFPIDESKTVATLSFEASGENESSFTFVFNYGTKPKFMAPLAKGSFRRLLEDYFVALEHFLVTGEEVNASTGNFREVKKAHKARHPG